MKLILNKISKYLPERRLGRNGEYLLRYFIFRVKKYKKWLPRVFLHKFLTSDGASKLHSHPFSGFSIILYGSYVEERLNNKTKKVSAKVCRFFNIIFNNTFHRVDLLTDEVWTLFVVLPEFKNKKYEWGFIDRNTLEYVSCEKFSGDLGQLEDID